MKRLIRVMLFAIFAFALAIPCASAYALENPRIVEDSNMTAGQKVTYDCIWFGSYPQVEIVDKAERCGAYRYFEPDTWEYIVNTRVYKALKNAKGWDENNDIVFEGNKYRRMKMSDAAYAEDSGGYYDWHYDDTTYHYFRYTPIKWRVLDQTISVPDNKFLLQADMILDNQQYNQENQVTTWETSTLRSFLNGLNSSNNNCGVDYTKKNFINSAFTPEEQNEIFTTELDNQTTGYYTWNLGGNDTKDEVFLLSEDDLYGNDHPSYGFRQMYSYDSATYRLPTGYARAMGCFYFHNDTSQQDYASWWTRSPGQYGHYAIRMNSSGRLDDNGDSVTAFCGICPAINMTIRNTELWKDAGTVCSDGTVNEKNKVIVLKSQPWKVSVKTKTVKYKKVKKKAQTVAPFTVKQYKGTLKYKITSGTAKARKALSINSKTGKITVKKKTKKGTYKVKVKVTASGNKYFESISATKTVTVKVK